jgi:hypothetical protein
LTEQEELKRIAAVSFLIDNPSTIPFKKENGFSYYYIPLLLKGCHDIKYFAEIQPQSEAKASSTIPKNIVSGDKKLPVKKNHNESGLFK